MNVVHIVWSPRRIEEALRSFEREAGHRPHRIPTAFICGYTEHEACDVATELVKNTTADVYLLSYDDQVITPEATADVLELQEQTGDVVSGWQRLADNSPYASAVRPEYGIEDQLDVGRDGCFYTVEQVQESPDALIPTIYFPFSLTAVPRELLLEVPFRALPQWVDESLLSVFPARDGKPYDKGSRSDWTLAVDLIRAGAKLWTARDAQVRHLAETHQAPSHKFYIAEDEPGVYWNRRPR